MIFQTTQLIIPDFCTYGEKAKQNKKNEDLLWENEIK